MEIDELFRLSHRGRLNMIKISTLKTLLDFKDQEIKKMKTEQLRLLLGVLRYATRIIQREMNEREPIIK